MIRLRNDQIALGGQLFALAVGIAMLVYGLIVILQGSWVGWIVVIGGLIATAGMARALVLWFRIPRAARRDEPSDHERLAGDHR